MKLPGILSSVSESCPTFWDQSEMIYNALFSFFTYVLLSIVLHYLVGILVSALDKDKALIEEQC